jgi:putative ubiquitin-RnfH superfamily antitoxin RatB of RatAB toxin-antitoxin module
LTVTLDPPTDAPSLIRLTLVWSPAARAVKELQIKVPDGCTALQAIRESGWLSSLDSELIDSLTLAVWGRKVSSHHILKDGDRLELIRPLKVDPKVARRERFNQQGARSAGLFTKRRTGGKAGY